MIVRRNLQLDWHRCARTVALMPMVAIVLGQPSVAATFRIDDSTTLPNEVTAAMKWKSLAPSRTAGHAVEGASVITIRLNLAPWLNKVGKIYMVLPQQPIGQVTVEWATQGKLLPGQLLSGNRTLVYSGPIHSNTLEDTIALKVKADGSRPARSQPRSRKKGGAKHRTSLRGSTD